MVRRLEHDRNPTNGVITMNIKTNVKAGRALIVPAVQKIRA